MDYFFLPDIGIGIFFKIHIGSALLQMYCVFVQLSVNLQLCCCYGLGSQPGSDRSVGNQGSASDESPLNLSKLQHLAAFYLEIFNNSFLIEPSFVYEAPNDNNSRTNKSHMSKRSGQKKSPTGRRFERMMSHHGHLPLISNTVHFARVPTLHMYIRV